MNPNEPLHPEAHHLYNPSLIEIIRDALKKRQELERLYEIAKKN
jgi:hypothetical protein